MADSDEIHTSCSALMELEGIGKVLNNITLHN